MWLHYWLWCAAASAASRRVRLVTPSHGEDVVSDRLQVVAAFDVGPAESGWLAAHGAPTPDQPICVQVDGHEPWCWSDHGPYGSVSAGVFVTFVDVEPRSRLRLLRLWIGPDDVAEAEASGQVLRSYFRLRTFDQCKSQPRRVFDVFPLYGKHEMDLLELRTRELSTVVDVFVPIEANVTHSGLPKRLEWRENRDGRFAQYSIEGFVADLSNLDPTKSRAAALGDLHLAREEQQRDYALQALRSLDARPDDLVIIADADEIASKAAIERVAGCRPAQLPAILEMQWFVYSFNWRAKRPWGLFGKEGAVVVSVAMLEQHDATFWRRQLRDENAAARPPASRLVKNGGWHASSFGGPAAVADKLASYIGSVEYGNDFYVDRDRLRRLAEAGVAYYELAGTGSRLFECTDGRDDDLPEAVDGRFFSNATCESEAEVDLDDDVLAARLNAASSGHFVLGGWGDDGDKRVFRPRLRCRDDIRAQLVTQCAAQGLATGACDQSHEVLANECATKLRAAELLHEDGDIIVTTPLSFEETTSVPITVDGRTGHIALSATDDVDQVARRACAAHSIPDDQCVALADRLRQVQPSPAWGLSPR